MRGKRKWNKKLENWKLEIGSLKYVSKNSLIRELKFTRTSCLALKSITAIRVDNF